MNTSKYTLSILVVISVYLGSVISTWTIPKLSVENAPQRILTANQAIPDICSLPVVSCNDPEAIIRQVAREQNIDENNLVRLASCESSLNPKAVGDNGNSRGLFQINMVYHNVPDQVAFDPELASRWSAQMIKDGRSREWTCVRKLGLTF